MTGVGEGVKVGLAVGKGVMVMVGEGVMDCVAVLVDDIEGTGVVIGNEFAVCWHPARKQQIPIIKRFLLIMPLVYKKRST